VSIARPDEFVVDLDEWVGCAGPGAEANRRLRQFYESYRGAQLLTPEDIENARRDNPAHWSELERRSRNADKRRPIINFLSDGKARFEGKHLVVERWVLSEVEVPLFSFSAPHIPGCEATVEASSKRGGSAGWKLSLGISGARQTFETSVAMKSSFTTDGTLRKSLFVKTPAILKWRLHIGEGLDRRRNEESWYEPSPFKRRTSALAVRGEKDLRWGASDIVERYHLTGDGSGSLSTYEYTYAQGVKSAIKFGAKDSGIELTTVLESELTLRFQLKGGYTYNLLHIGPPDHSTPGISWEVEGVPEPEYVMQSDW
jgi:hypothetical protein